MSKAISCSSVTFPLFRSTFRSTRQIYQVAVLQNGKINKTIRPNELGQLMSDISYASIRLVTRCLIEWQLHTMSRPIESAKAQWCEIDFENKLWVVPAERMKMRLEHKVPLSPQALEILSRLKTISGDRTYLIV